MPDFFAEPKNLVAKFNAMGEVYKYLATETKLGVINGFLKILNPEIKALRPPLQIGLYSHEQEPALWHELVQRVTNRRLKRDVAQYENAWPIKLIWDIRVKKYLMQEKISRASVPIPSTNSAQQSASEPRTRSTEKAIAERSRSPNLAAPPEHPETIEVEDGANEAGFSQAKQLSSTSRGSSRTVVYVGCYDCGRPLPNELVGTNSGLRALIGELNLEQLRVLFEAGLQSDAHLAMFLEWAAHDRKRFVDRLDATPFARQALLRKLVTKVGDAPSSNAPSLPRKRTREALDDSEDERREERIPLRQPYRHSGCLQPGLEEEEKMTDPAQPVDLLYNAMELSNRDLFNEIWGVVSLSGSQYLMTYHSTREQFDAIVKAISRERLLFERYENHWPIRFILKRIARGYRAPFDDHLSSASQSSSSTLVGTQPDDTPVTAPLMFKFTCPYHPGHDTLRVSMDVQRCLRSRSTCLVELVPAFAMVGIRTKEDLRQFCRFPEEEKDAILESTISLNLFQRFSVNVELTEDKVDLLLSRFA
ncbi:hypothetical protein DFP72DRAFT_873788 [Ephemerocybe angulata]|uniref:Uncharacterized protein n=1 Tax=Ephemerocybe angulata TaxID=980116 RepID=A0A8H6IGC2_9AGAR|nr:hypothetical protein DFP72DRAFT_873788 [Tulosesus angulatus]